MEASLDRSFAQPVKFTPISQHEDVSASGDATADLDRSVETVNAIFETSFINYQLGRNMKGMRNDSFNEIMDDFPICLLKKGSLTFDLKKGDELEVVDANDLYSISNIKPDELGRILLSLKKITVSQI